MTEYAKMAMLWRCLAAGREVTLSKSVFNDALLRVEIVDKNVRLRCSIQYPVEDGHVSGDPLRYLVEHICKVNSELDDAMNANVRGKQ